jgi:hypothetical protein
MQAAQTGSYSTDWVEDCTWTRTLDAGWNLAAVRDMARPLLDKYQNQPGVLAVSN